MDAPRPTSELAADAEKLLAVPFSPDSRWEDEARTVIAALVARVTDLEAQLAAITGTHVHDWVERARAAEAQVAALTDDLRLSREAHWATVAEKQELEAQVAALTQERDRVHRALDAAGIGEGTAASRVGKLRGDKEAAEAALAATRQALKWISANDPVPGMLGGRARRALAATGPERCSECGHVHRGDDGWCDARVCGDGCCHCPCHAEGNTT